jgi:hypothetical protein
MSISRVSNDVRVYTFAAISQVLCPEVDHRLALENNQEEIEDAESNDTAQHHPDCNLLALPDTDPVEENANAGF